MKKKTLIAIVMGIIIATVLTIYIITTNAASMEVGDFDWIGVDYYYDQIEKVPDSNYPNKKVINIMGPNGLNYFCAKHGSGFISTDGRNYEYGQFNNKVNFEIIGNTVKLTATVGDSTDLYTETYTEEGTYANKAMSLLFYKIKSGTVEVDELDIKYDSTQKTYVAEKTGNKIDLERSRMGNTSFYTFAFDFGQSAMWRELQYWRNTVGEKLDTEKQSTWGSKYVSYIQSADLQQDLTSGYNVNAAWKSYFYGQQLFSDVMDEVKQTGIDNKYGIEEAYYNKPNTAKEIETRVENGEYTILGPFKYNFAGTLENGKPTLTFNDETTVQEYTIGTYEGSNFVETDEIVSGNKFYIKILTSTLNKASSIHFNFQVEGINLDTTKTTLSLLIQFGKDMGTWQPILRIDQEEGENEPFEDIYNITKPVDVSIEKKDESGNALKAEGIKFIITDDTYDAVAYLKTDANGNGILVDSQWNATGETKVKLLAKQTYILSEMVNNVYGYKGCKLSVDNIEIEGAKIEQDGNNIKFYIESNDIEEVTIKVKNQKELANMQIEKVGENDTKLENVAFVIQIDSTQYLQLKDSNGETVTTIKGEATINSENKANSNEYHVEYVNDKSVATQFITDKNGKVLINNLEVNKQSGRKYTYKACEVSNFNYGYGSSANTTLVGSATKLEPNQTTEIKITNKLDLGNLKLEKYDEEYTNVKLENVGFAIEISPALENTYAYLAIYDKNGNIVSSIKEQATINRQNIANDNEYEVRYYYTDKKISEMSEDEKANITTFITGSEGTLVINNLEVYSPKTGDKYTYKLIETSNTNYGYDIKITELASTKLETDETVNVAVTNKIKFTRISGYVWIENSSGKANDYDFVYTEGASSSDIKLTDLYIYEEGKLVKNPGAITNVEIKLRDKQTGEIIKALPDEFDGNGKYTFKDIEIEKLSNYEVVFIYNGYYYTTITEQTEKENGSKVKEVIEERETLNNKFATVKENGEIVATDGTVNTVEYQKDGHTSTVSSINFDTTISANTTAANYNLKEAFDTLKANSSSAIKELGNINMGIVLREQPKTSVNEDIYSVLVEFDGYQYNYKYNGRQNFYENKNNDDIGVKFEQENTEKRYTRTVYASDIQAAKDQNKEIKVSVTYKIQIANESRTLSVLPKQLINYFDARYEIKAVGLNLNSETHEVTDALTFSQAQEVEGHPEYKMTIIDFNQIIDAGNLNVKSLYITFDIQRDAILDLLNQKSTYHNAVEVLSYASYYGEDTSKVDGVQFATDNTKAGNLYAGIDKVSQPGNMEIVLVDHPTVDGTKILDTANFEDDTSSAPSLLLEAGEAREISGTIWEDSATNTADNQRLGDGIYSEGEKPIQNVTVELHRVDSNGNIENEVATYSNNKPATTVTDENGNYTFGYYDENKKEYVGVLPGKYIIKYIYNDETFIVGSKNINPNDYKSTIIASEVIKNAFEGQNLRWYLQEEGNRYSDAKDNIYLRPEYNSEVDTNATIKNSTYNTFAIDKMEANTPVMEIGIEFTETDEDEALVLEFVNELKNIDFGIIERPNIDIKIEKEITGLEVISQVGANIIPKGDPSDPDSTMQNVKTGLDGLVSAEIEAKLLQSATLNVEYTITIKNNSEKDYLEPDYYYYGKNGKTETTTRVKQVVDYMEKTMVIDETKLDESWTIKTATDLYNTEGVINEDVYNELKSENYYILTTNAFENVTSGEEKSIKLYASKTLAVSDTIEEQNHVEVIELTGKRRIKESIPGNYNPATSNPDELDNDKVELVITPPTGTTVNYIIYIIAIAATFTILIVGTLFIKKKIIKQ